MRDKSTERGRSWRGNILAVLGALLAGAAFLTVQNLAADLRTANEARDALAQQVQQLGGTPVAGKPGSRGDVGPSGAPGRDGRDGQPAPTITPRPGATGPPGKPGSDSTVPGPSGVPGQQGANGQAVVGPSGPPGKDGMDGEKGDTGDTGERGPEGPAGASCPDGYSWQAPKGDPDALVCRRDGAPPPREPGLLSSAALDPSRRQYP